MEISEVLRKALREVDQAGIESEQLRAVAFERAIEMIWQQHTGEMRRHVAVPQDKSVGVSSDESWPLARLAKKLELDLDAVVQVYDVVDGEVRVIVPNSRVDQKKAGGTKELALLVAAGRQGAGLEEWTAVSVIRDVCRDYKRLDSPNFAGAMKGLDHLFNARGNGPNREVRMSKPAWSEVRELILRLVGGGEG